MAGNVDGRDLGEPKVPQQTGVDERRYEAAGCGIDVNVDVDVALDEEVVDSFDVFVFAGVGASENGAYISVSIHGSMFSNRR